MNRFKINVDRKVPDSEYIQSKQNFKEVLNQVAAANTSIWQSTWFYGTIGLASVAIVTSFTFLTPNDSNAYDAKNTSSKQITTTQKQEVPVSHYTVGTFSHVQQSNDEPVQLAMTQPSGPEKKKRPVKPVTAPTTVSEQTEQTPVVVDRTEQQPTGVPNHAEQPAPVEKVRSNRPGIPNISGVYNGEIRINELCEGKVEVNRELLITSFLIQYSSRLGDRSQQVQGNHITPEICEEIRQLGVDQMIFVTNILAEDLQGDKHMVIPMNFTVVME